MKSIKRFLIATAGAASLMLPMGLGAVAYAQAAPDTTPLKCNYTGSSEFPEGTCDLAVDKLVSVNGGGVR